jgi:putative flippase GtrA
MTKMINKLFNIFFSKNKFKLNFIQFMKFNIVGVLNTAIDFCVFTLLTFLLVNSLLAQAISYGCGMVNSYFLNRNWTFAKRNEADMWQAARFVTVNLTALGISMAVLYLMNTVLLVNVFASKLAATVFSIAVNFLGNKFWVF